jgi:hypothetical protein
MPTAPFRRRQAVLLGLFRSVRQVVTAVRNVLTGACHGIAAGECRSPRNEKQSDESSHECSPFEECIDGRAATSAPSLASDRASRQPIRSDCILKNERSRRCQRARDFLVGVLRCLCRSSPTCAVLRDRARRSLAKCRPAAPRARSRGRRASPREYRYRSARHGGYRSGRRAPPHAGACRANHACECASDRRA